MSKYTKKQVTQLNNLYQSGMNKIDACKEMNIPEGSFSYLMKKHGFFTRPSGFQPNNTTSSQFQLGEQFNIICKECKKEFTVPKWEYLNNRKYCSQSCRSSHSMRGDKHWNWQGGKSTQWDKLHNSQEYKAWRLAVWSRDHFSCQKCGVKQSRTNPLHAHHIKPKSKYPELVLDIDNGLTVCKKCHLFIHYGHAGRHG